MKVILLQDVAKIGRRFDIVDVPSGYGMNKLIPQAMAKPATPENIKAIIAQSDKTEAHRAAADDAFKSVLESLKDTVLTIAVKANEEGRMFQALTLQDIIDAVKEATQKEIPSNQIMIKTPIKEIGEHTVDFISGDMSTSVVVTLTTK